MTLWPKAPARPTIGHFFQLLLTQVDIKVQGVETAYLFEVAF